MAKKSEYGRKNKAQVKPEIMTTQTTYKQPELAEEVVEESTEKETITQNCGRCKSYIFGAIKGFLYCKVRGGRRPETAGTNCNKFKGK